MKALLQRRERLEAALACAALLACQSSCQSDSSGSDSADNAEGGANTSSSGIATSGPAAADAPPDPGGPCAVPGAISAFAEVDLRNVDFAEERLYGFAGLHGQAIGTPCKTAHDQATCLHALATLAPTSSFPVPATGGGNTYVAYSRGDTVGAITTNSEFVQTLGEIDTPARASILASLNNYQADCDAMRQSANGYYFTISLDACDGTMNQIVSVHLIAKDGTLSLISAVTQLDPTGNSSGVCGAGRGMTGLSVECSVPPRELSHDDEDPRQSLVRTRLGRMVATEALSVVSFRRLARELRAHGAPASLCDWAKRCAREEIRHARVLARHAARYRARPARVHQRPPESRRLIDLAIENMTEGCVGELFGALMLTYQAQASSDPELARDFAAIARDEAGHAQLAFAIDDWAREQLDPADRARIDDARNKALAALARRNENEDENERENDDAILGLPTRKHRQAIAQLVTGIG